MYNKTLKISIIESGRKGYEISNELYWHPSKLSQIIIGAHRPNSYETSQLAGLLGKTVSELFPESNPQVTA
jgi:hypothetical protein